ncbi:adenosylcobalamin-dependent ribonucleoside-diphosphate reductase [Marispirochaeta sp.]|uniref:adenosylcobalamin-dependent ribonucleoside-diphosphate reductase n=1 Tax=Marispirochaeta sp. TaxID=2038653 RepID=UPI0029C6B01A|nr:adenosylcobalamin-dependent ribonucleoside-diphosphate reductase [Marispirochaeta sp.]
MKITRLFTGKSGDPYEGIEWIARESEIRNPDGGLIFQQKDVIVPAGWSQIATDIMAQKYFRKAGLPDDSGAAGGETDARQVFHRLAQAWRSWGEKAGYFDAPEDAQVFYDEVRYMLARQMGAPNSPQWFNTGLYDAYGIEGPPQGHYYIDPESGKLKKSSSAYKRPQPHACFIMDVEDNLVSDEGILDLVTREARLFKYGSGTGSNFSKIRAEGEPLSGGGISSGLLSFLKIADRSASAIKSGGTTRRAAKMVILDSDHPDIEKFIDWKMKEEYKVACMTAGSKKISSHAAALLQAVRDFSGDENARTDPNQNPELKSAIKAALADEIPQPFIYPLIRMAEEEGELPDFEIFDTDWQGEAYTTVSGQSSNNSVRITQEFMEAVLEDREYALTARTDGHPVKIIRARDLWDKIARAAWKCADPGLQFHSTINEWHTCPAGGEIRGSNPCSEYMFLDNTACNLASLNLMRFYDPDSGTFMVEEFRHAVRLWTMILEISVYMAQFPSEEVARLSYEYRTLGLGYANLGTLLMVMGKAYDSDEGRSIAGAISALLSGEAYAFSAKMAAQAGPFPRFQENREAMLRVIRNHRRAAFNSPRDDYESLSVYPAGIDDSKCPADLRDAAVSAWDRALELGEAHGYRNAQVSAIAPTGTIGLLMDCDTTGIEPDFALVKFKKLAGGGYFKIINQSIQPALAELGFDAAQQREIIAYCLGHGSLEGAPGISRAALEDKGFRPEDLDRIDAALASSVSLTGCFQPYVLGEEFYQQVLNIPAATYTLPGFNLLAHLGFSQEEIDSAEDYACGTMTLEGAPHLDTADLAVFDTASPGGRRGRRSIPWQAHIEMMAAVQPFISGAISKTINMPAGATIEDVKGAHYMAWQRMLKSIALYRDGSKLSQPLSSLSPGADMVADAILRLSREKGTEKTQEAPAQSVSSRGRQLLPNRRDGYTQKAKIGGHSLFLRTGDYRDGSLGEIFLDMHKEGAAFRSLLNSFAIAVSLGLQYGVPLKEYVDAFTFTRFEPNGIVQGHQNIKMATSVLDFIFRDLALTYLHRTDLAQVKPEDLDSTETTGSGSHDNNGEHKTAEDAAGISAQEARFRGYEGDPCPSCGHFTLVRNGTCLKCETCGGTTGCS